jgi:P-type E1-E2 ATPase
VTLAYGDWRDALFLGILAANTTIGVVQELRAKRALDRLSALVAPTALVVRSGRARRVAAEEVVPGELVVLAAGDQLVADGTLERADDLRLDESILTGESRPVARAARDEVRSGSFAVEGAGLLRVTAVGAESYAERLAAVARGFRHRRSPLERALDRLLLALVALTAPLALALGLSLWLRGVPRHEAVPTAVAAIVNLVPEGLILLTSLAFAVAALRMARRGALAQQLNAIESLASVDVVCLDKTGTLTEPRLRVVEIVPAPGIDEAALRAGLGRYGAGSRPRNATAEALLEAFPVEVEAAESVPFSSRRRFGAVRGPSGWLVLGAPELLAGPLAGRAREQAARGRRVVALAVCAEAPSERDGAPALPRGLRTLGLAVLAERLRPSTADAVAYLHRQGVDLVVLSGDAPQTAAAIAADAGVAQAAGLAADSLPDDPGALAAVVQEARVVGRVSPEDKRRVVEALERAGRYVAMVGDGVNDVPALLDLPLDARHRPAAERDSRRDPRRLPERVVADVDHGEAVDLADPGSGGLDRDRSLGDELVDPLLEQVRAVLAPCDRGVDVLREHEVAAHLARPEARLGDDVCDLDQPGGELALALSEPPTVLDDARHRSAVEVAQAVLPDAPTDERRVIAHVLFRPRHLRGEVDLHLEELPEILVEGVEEVVELGRADEDDLEREGNRLRLERGGRDRGELLAQVLDPCLACEQRPLERVP